jgi:hypothetical protein
MKHLIPLLLSGTLALAACGGSSDEGGADEAAAASTDPVAEVTDHWFDWWAESAGETAESLGLEITDVVDRDCIASWVGQMSPADLEWNLVLARGDVPEGDLTADGDAKMESLRDECIDFTGG